MLTRTKQKRLMPQLLRWTGLALMLGALVFSFLAPIAPHLRWNITALIGLAGFGCTKAGKRAQLEADAKAQRNGS